MNISDLYITDDPYEDIIALKDDSNAFIGAGCKDFPVSASRKQVAVPLVLMPTSGGLLAVEMQDVPAGAS